jgi:uncharacterized GH25 family protein
MKRGLQIGSIMIILLWGSLAGAHSLWLNMDGHRQVIGHPITIDIGWGHKFPKDGEIPEGMLTEVVAINPDGKTTPLKQLSKTAFQFVPQTEGVYMIRASVHPGFVSKTTQGYHMGPKTGLNKVVSCFHYDIRTSTFVRAGDKGAMPVPGTGDPLEMIPLKDLFGLKQDDNLPIKVQFRGKPLSGARVCGTYAGFSEKPNVFAQTVETNAEGVAFIKITRTGDWIVSVTHEIPYPNTKECDTDKYNVTMTFDVP